jgi:hypothetical protein
MSATAKKAKLEAVEELEAELPPPVEEVVAAIDAEVDAKLETVKLKFRGHDFEIPKLMDEWETEACLAMNEGNYVLAAKLLLGPMQWPLLLALGNKRKDIREFLSTFADVVDKECVA